MSNPPIAGPSILVILKAAEFRAMAFMRSFLGTKVATKACRTGFPEAHPAPLSIENAKICQVSRCPDEINNANNKPRTDNNKCTTISKVFLLTRSVITPAIGPMNRKGSARIPVTAPVINADPVSS